MNNIRLYIFIAAGILILLIDAITPLGFGEWLLYIVLTYFYVIYSNKKQIYILTTLYLIFIVIGYFLSPPIQNLTYIPIINRLVAILIVVLFASLGLKEKEARKISSDILERIKDLFIALDRRLHIIFLNKSAKEVTGISEEAVGRNYFELFPDTRNTVFEQSFNDALNKQKLVQFEGEIISKGNFLDVSVYPSKDGISVFAKDITKTKKLLNEKEVLLREIHHRTKNNFQLILSLLNLQINNIKDEVSLKILNETRARVLSVASLYDKLLLSGGVYTVNIEQFIKEIISKMDTAANFGIIKMDYELDIEEIHLKLDTAVPIGLIINELYTNSLKYAFNGSRRGAIKINIHYDDDSTLCIKYKDNGKGLPENFDIGNNAGLGSSIISSFVEQLEGRLEYHNDHGAEFIIHLKIPQEVVEN